MNEVQISLCHSTARLPGGWKKAALLWRDRCDRLENVEYILGVDNGTQDLVGLSREVRELGFMYSGLAINEGRKCAVDGWNATAKVAHGKLLITVADDWYPCEHWDTRLLEQIPDLNGEWVVDVRTGGNDGLLTFSILTRSYFDRLTRDYGYQGGFFYHEYLGMWADNDFDMLAKRDGVVIAAKDLFFEHDHPVYKNEPLDEIHQWQHRPEAWRIGEEVFRRRARVFGFKLREPEFKRPLFACILPGSVFSQAWVGNWTSILSTLMDQFRVTVQYGYSSNVYFQRQGMLDALKAGPRPDFILWIDDDQILTLENLNRLISDLKENQELDIACGWAWCEGDIYGAGTPKLSCGVWDQGECRRLQYEEMERSRWDLIPIAYSGFPAVLMRGSVLDRLPERAFLPLYDEKQFPPYGMSGEDVAFFFRAERVGIRSAVDRRVKVPHLKLRCAEPVSRTSLEEQVVPQSEGDVNGSDRYLHEPGRRGADRGANVAAFAGSGQS